MYDSSVYWPPLHPDRVCLDYETCDTKECTEQWSVWEDYCDYEWTDMCETLDAIWYDQDLDWLYPTPVDAECLASPDLLSDECLEQWDTLRDQCYDELDEGPYMWTEHCDAMEMLDDAFTSWFWADWADEWSEMDWAIALHKRVERLQMKRPESFQQLSLALKPETLHQTPES